MINLKIRPVKKDDLDAVTQLENACFNAAEAGTRASFKERIAAFKTSFFVAEHNGHLIGMINGCITNDTVISDPLYEEISTHFEDGSYQSIFGLDVLPAYQHQGIGAMLMRHFIDTAKKAGRKGLILTCKKHLIPYYQKFGYHNTGISKSTHGGAVWYDMILVF